MARKRRRNKTNKQRLTRIYEDDLSIVKRVKKNTRANSNADALRKLLKTLNDSNYFEEFGKELNKLLKK